MSTIVRTSMRQQIYDELKHRILTQQYDLGEPINLVSLSKEFSISNTPIREAVSMLNAEGLVVSNLNAQFRVIDFNETTMRELNETAYILESGAYRMCCREKKHVQLANLLEQALEEQLKAVHNNFYDYIFLAIDFDRCFIKISDNDKLLSFFNRLADLLFLSVRYAYQNNTMALEENLNEHKELLAAVRRQDNDQVEALLYHHYDKHK